MKSLKLLFAAYFAVGFIAGAGFVHLMYEKFIVPGKDATIENLRIEHETIDHCGKG